MDVLELYLIGIISSVFVMGGCTLIYLKTKRGDIVDLGWAFLLFLQGIIVLKVGEGGLLPRMILSLMIFLWSGRLFLHLLFRFLKSGEDPRYKKIRESDDSGAQFLSMFLFQGALLVLLSTPFYLRASDPDEGIHFSGFIAIFVFLIGLIGQTAADEELRRFRALGFQGAVYRKGLFSLSRHPNYFFEWVIWIAFALFALESPFGIFGLISPVIMLILLLYVTGIPPLEEEAVKKKGELYLNYQKEVNAFFPFPRFNRRN